VVLVSHEVDHVIAQKHGGATTAENLALSCTTCNNRKGTDLTSIDPADGSIALLFNPRREQWNEHFRLSGSRIEGLTPTGRATIALLHLNAVERLVERNLLIAAGLIGPRN